MRAQESVERKNSVLTEDVKRGLIDLQNQSNQLQAYLDRNKTSLNRYKRGSMEEIVAHRARGSAMETCRVR